MHKMHKTSEDIVCMTTVMLKSAVVVVCVAAMLTYILGEVQAMASGLWLPIGHM